MTELTGWHLSGTVNAPIFLANGDSYRIRLVEEGDKEGLIDLFNHLSEQSRYFRFAHAVSVLPEALVDVAMQARGPSDFMLIAILEGGGACRIIGGSRCITDCNGNKGEFSLSVRDDSQHSGIGAHLMRSLLDYARHFGLIEIYGFVDKENHKMVSLMKHLDYNLASHPNDPKLFIASNLTR